MAGASLRYSEPMAGRRVRPGHGLVAVLVLGLAGGSPVVAGGQASAAKAPEAGESETLAAVAVAGELIAKGSYRQAVERLAALPRPFSPPVDALIGRALALDRRYLAAEEPLQRAVDAGWRDLPTLFYLGSTLWENGKLDEAATVFAAALETSEGHPVVLHQLGRLELWRGHWEEAARRLEQALAAAPGNFDAGLDRARALEGTGRTADALEAYRAVVAQAPEHSGARYGLARLLLATGAGEEGRRELETFRRLHQREQEATRAAGRQRAELDRGLALLRNGDVAGAVEHLSALAPTADGLDALSRALDAAGRHEESLRALERAVALAPERRDLRDRLTEGRLARSTADTADG